MLALISLCLVVGLGVWIVRLSKRALLDEPDWVRLQVAEFDRLKPCLSADEARSVAESLATMATRRPAPGKG